MTMTETDHFSLLRQGKAAWSAWREANPSIHPDLREANLTGANLAGALLGGADLGKANLSRANLTDAILGGSDFGGARGIALFRAWGLIDYGRSLLRVAAISFGLAAIYGAIYRIFPHVLDYKDSANTWFTPYYFSIVTYTTLGFGDVRPATLAGEIILSSEVILGYTTLGLLLSVLAQSIARRS
jgi:hypothetical protein